MAYEVARMWPERVQKVVIASCAVNMKKKDKEELLKRANVEKIEDLLLPATAAQLRTLLSLSTFRRLPYLPDFMFNDLLEVICDLLHYKTNPCYIILFTPLLLIYMQKLYVQNREEKIKLLEGLSHGRDDTVDRSPLQQVIIAPNLKII